MPREFFARDPRLVARELLGKLLIRVMDGEVLAGRIVEAEAYLGGADPGAHSYRGMTPRKAGRFGPLGHADVYFIYGNHYCTNVSSHADGESGCGVLLRALEPVAGIARMAALRGIALPPEPRPSQLRLLTSGPGRLSQALAITREEHNGVDLCSVKGGLYMADDGSPAPQSLATVRINVTSAPHDLWRYVVRDNVFVSGPRTIQSESL